MRPTTNASAEPSEVPADPPTASAGNVEEETQYASGRVRRWCEAYSMIGLLATVVIAFSFYGPTSGTFPTAGNLRILLASQSVLAIVALAALVPLVCEEYDLSVGATAGLSSVTAASALSAGTPVIQAMVLALLVGIIVGLVNSFLITVVRINAIIATLGTAAVIAGIVSQRTSGLAIVGSMPEALRSFGRGQLLGLPLPFYVLVFVAASVYYALEHTPLGRYLYAIGSNVQAARLVGLRTNRLLGTTFVMSGSLAGFAGVLQVAYQGGADPRVGPSFTLPALAAAFLSAAAIRPGVYNARGTIVAIFFLASLNSGLNLAGAPPYVTNYVNGIALLVGVGLAVLLQDSSDRDG